MGYYEKWDERRGSQKDMKDKRMIERGKNTRGRQTKRPYTKMGR